VPSESLYIKNWLASNRLTFRNIRVKVSSDIRSPLTYGVLRPVILIPKHVVSGSGRELDYLLAHELIHVKSFHVLWKWLLLLAACIHWYNPFVWVMYVLANRDLEIICDEAAVRLFDERRAGEYASVLLRLSQLPQPFMPLSNGFGRTSIEERIALIMKKSKIRPLDLEFRLTSVFAALSAIVYTNLIIFIFSNPAGCSIISVIVIEG
jgi:beta-lactamase regulating signal transducer with metallopeptidase domain